MSHRAAWWRGAAALAAVALVLGACSSSKKKVATTGGTTGGATNAAGVKIGFFGALTGPNSPQLGINEAATIWSRQVAEHLSDDNIHLLT